MSDADGAEEFEHGQCKAKSNAGDGSRCPREAIEGTDYCGSHQTPDPEKTKYGRCTATSHSTGKQCGKHAVGDHGKCEYHGGRTPTKKENPKQGQGDIDGNGNAIDHGATAKPLNLYRHLDAQEQQWIDSLVQGYVDHLNYDATDPRLERILRACIHIYQSWSAEDRILEDGLSEDSVVGVNDNGQPIVTKSGHHLHQFSVQRDKQAQRILGDLGAFDDSGADVADELGNMSSDSYTIVVNSDSDTEDSDADSDADPDS